MNPHSLSARDQLEYAAARTSGLLYLLAALATRDNSAMPAPPTREESEGIVMLAHDAGADLSRAVGSANEAEPNPTV